jgi:hypothetical protein
LALTLRRDINCDQALNWMVSGFRGLAHVLPAQAKQVSDGAISHARVKLGVEVFRVLWTKLVASFQPRPADFHGLTSVIFDGSTGTMPDTETNRATFGKPSARTGAAAFPQVRLMGLLADCQIDRPRRPRLNPRVVKVKMSQWGRKTEAHTSEVRDMAEQLKTVDIGMDGVTARKFVHGYWEMY